VVELVAGAGVVEDGSGVVPSVVPEVLVVPSTCVLLWSDVVVPSVNIIVSAHVG
jgi:hypothetical protein